MVEVDFSQLVQAVDEGDGQVEVCVILRGQTERDITVTVSTMSGTATVSGKKYFVLKLF